MYTTNVNISKSTFIREKGVSQLQIYKRKKSESKFLLTYAMSNEIEL